MLLLLDFFLFHLPLPCTYWQNINFKQVKTQDKIQQEWALERVAELYTNHQRKSGESEALGKNCHHQLATLKRLGGTPSACNFSSAQGRTSRPSVEDHHFQYFIVWGFSSPFFRGHQTNCSDDGEQTRHPNGWVETQPVTWSRELCLVRVHWKFTHNVPQLWLAEIFLLGYPMVCPLFGQRCWMMLFLYYLLVFLLQSENLLFFLGVSSPFFGPESFLSMKPSSREFSGTGEMTFCWHATLLFIS